MSVETPESRRSSAMVVPTVTGFPRLPFRRVIGLVALLAVVLVGCTPQGGDSTAPTATTAAAGTALPTTQAPTTNGQAAEKANVLAAYRAFWDDVVAATATSDAASPRLARHATGAELRALRVRLEANKRAGLVARGSPKLLDTTIASVTEKAATVRDCMDSNQWLYHDAKTGALRDKPSGKLYAVTATLVLDRGSWKVATLRFQEARCNG